MVYYKPVKVIINASGLAELIIDVVVRYYGLPDSIISERGAIFTSIFWSSLYYFYSIKRLLSMTFSVQTDRKTE